ncbi:MAG: FHA domain-containing protein [Verrucomicrobiae bacterium]|nr:FHA domain-containing protein [Verrucomicrobiae bacterium]
MPKLYVLSGVQEGKVFELTEERITIGRAMDNIIRLEDGTVSHHHAMLILDGPDYKLRDLNSTNGTRVNGMRIVETKLTHGDQLRLGSVEMRYESDSKKASQPLPPTQTGVDLSDIGQRAAPAPTFAPTTTFGRKKKSGPSFWVWVAIGLAIPAVALVALVLLKLFNLL